MDKAAIEQPRGTAAQYAWITTSGSFFPSACAGSARRSARCTIPPGRVLRRGTCRGNAGALPFLSARADDDLHHRGLPSQKKRPCRLMSSPAGARHDCGRSGALTEACAICQKCAYPAAPCRHPERMFPCVESQGILVTDLAEKHGLDFMNGNIVVWFRDSI